MPAAKPLGRRRGLKPKLDACLLLLRCSPFNQYGLRLVTLRVDVHEKLRALLTSSAQHRSTAEGSSDDVELVRARSLDELDMYEARRQAKKGKRVGHGERRRQELSPKRRKTGRVQEKDRDNEGSSASDGAAGNAEGGRNCYLLDSTDEGSYGDDFGSSSDGLHEDSLNIIDTSPSPRSAAH